VVECGTQDEGSGTFHVMLLLPLSLAFMTTRLADQWPVASQGHRHGHRLGQSQNGAGSGQSNAFGIPTTHPAPHLLQHFYERVTTSDGNENDSDFPSRWLLLLFVLATFVEHGTWNVLGFLICNTCNTHTDSHTHSHTHWQPSCRM